MPSPSPSEYDVAAPTITPFPPAQDPELGLKTDHTPPGINSRYLDVTEPITGDRNVVYTYIPRWPLAGDPKDTLGPIYPTRAQTLEVIRRSFADLQAVPSERIELSCPVQTAVLGEEPRWTTIADESWPMIAAHPPGAMRVMVADLPGEAAAREAHYKALRDSLRCHRFTYFFFGLAALVLVIVLPVYFTQR